MRIQHNIMAMNAYRNYNNNASLLSGNLEKLSSGYKINRAGDDAAGLAISEKMRAQISGLEAAEKNVKDGVSLVKTGEGAMQEVQDMLNRMVTLATQSANGTYDDSVDRANLQKEVVALKDEINRIADSSNFNGIKLLDGSLANGVDNTVSASLEVGDELPEVGEVLGENTVLHNFAKTHGTSFSVDLHNVGFTNLANQTLTIKLGDSTTVSLAGSGTVPPTDNSAALTAQEIVETISGTTTVGDTGATTTINGQSFNIYNSGNGRLTFTQVAPPTSEAEEVDGSMTVSVTGGIMEGTAGFVAGAKTVYSVEVTAGARYTVADTIVADGGTLTVVADGAANVAANQITESDAEDAGIVASKLAAQITANSNDWTVTADGGNLIYTAQTAGALGSVGAPTAAPAPADAGTNAQVTAGDPDAALAAFGPAKRVTAGTDPVVMGTVLVDYNVSTTVIDNVESVGTDRLASTYFSLTEDMAADGATLTIGHETYQFTSDKDLLSSTPTGNTKYVDVSSGDMDTVAKKLTEAAASNDVFTVGHDGSRITVTELVSYAENTAIYNAVSREYVGGEENFDLSTQEGFAKALSFVGAKTVGKSLTLQIGDTSDDYNQLSVSITDIHTKSLGIADVDISTQEGAATAIDKIKAAINTVSSTRGDLGAIQNRLEHTGNNLSVMAENIQDAESTIRDTDMAEEMMAYTKNNILVQAAQSMLAQANSVPQGVLQLLQ